MIKRIAGIFLAIALAVTFLLPQSAITTIAAEDNDSVVMQVYTEEQLVSAMTSSELDVVIELMNDIELSTAGTASTGSYIPKGSSVRITYEDGTHEDVVTKYIRTIKGNNHTISVSDDYALNIYDSALIYMNDYTELDLYDVTIDGEQADRCIFERMYCTLRLYEGTVITSGGRSDTTYNSGLGIYVVGASSDKSELYMYEGSTVTDCVAGINSSASTRGIGIYATEANLYLHGEISGCSVAEDSDAEVTGNVYGGAVYLNSNCNAYVYDTAQITGNSVTGTSGTANGGAFWCGSSGTNIYMYGGTVSGNTAASGGAFYFSATSNLYLHGGMITGNTADGGQGGAVFTGAYTNLVVSDLCADVSITGNTAVRGSGDRSTAGKGAGIYDLVGTSGEFSVDTGDSGYTVSITGNYDIVTAEGTDGSESEVSRTQNDVYLLQTGLTAAGDVEIGSIRMVEDASLLLSGLLTGSIGIYPLNTDDDEVVVACPADGYYLTADDLGALSCLDSNRIFAFNADACVIAKAVSETAQADISGAEVTVDAQPYTGEALEPVPEVTLDGTSLEEGTDFVVLYSNNTEAGTATAMVYGIGDYTGTKEVSFEITAKDLSDADVVMSGPEASYATSDNTTPVCPDVTITVGDTTLVSGTDYVLSYENNCTAGTATLTVTGTGNYTGSRTATFTIEAYAAESGTTVAMVTDQETLEAAIGTYSEATDEDGNTETTYTPGTCDVILLANDIAVSSRVEVSRDVTIDGNGFTLTSDTELTLSTASDTTAILSVSSGTLALQDITLDGNGLARSLYIAQDATVNLEESAVVTGTYDVSRSGVSIYNLGMLNLNGCTIRDGNAAGNRNYIYNGSGAQLTMNEGTLITNVDARPMISNAGTFTMAGGTILAGYADTSTTGYAVANTGTFTMAGGVIDGLLADGETYLSYTNGLVYCTDGEFVMTGGEIRHFNNTSTSSTNGKTPGAVTVYGTGASFTLDGGTITENTANVGAGVYLSNGGSFVMDSGSICGNICYGTASTSTYGSGAGVLLSYYKSTPSFVMNGGTIENNTGYLFGSYAKGSTASGAGVFSNGSNVTLNGGKITGNNIYVNETSAESYANSGRGAGVYVASYSKSYAGSLTVNGTEISGNGAYLIADGSTDASDMEVLGSVSKGVGIFVYEASTSYRPSLSIGGTGDIAITDDVYLNSNNIYFSIDSTLLADGRSVAVNFTLPDDVGTGGRVIAKYASGVSGSAEDAACFTSENQEVVYDESASCIRIPTLDAEITSVQLTGDDSYTYTYDADKNLPAVYYTGSEILPAVSVTISYTDTDGTTKTKTLSESEYTLSGTNNVNVTDEETTAVMTISTAGMYGFEDTTLEFSIVKATEEMSTISLTNSDIETDEDGNMTLSGIYLDGADFGAVSSLGADVEVECEVLDEDGSLYGLVYSGLGTAGDELLVPGTVNATTSTGYTVETEGYIFNCVGTLRVKFYVEETDNYAAAEQELTLTIDKADQVVRFTSDEVNDPAMQAKENYYSVSGELYSTLDLGFVAYRTYTTYSVQTTSGGSSVYGGISTDVNYDSDNPLDSTITVTYVSGTDESGNDADDIVSIVDEDGNADESGLLLYLEKQGQAVILVQAQENDFYNASSTALTTDEGSFADRLGFTGNIKVNVNGLEQNIDGMTMALGDGEAEDLIPDEDEIYHASVDYIDTDGSYLVFTPSSDADLAEGQEATIRSCYMSTSSKSTTGDKLTYDNTVNIAISDDGKSLIVTPKAAGTVTFQVEMAAVGDYAVSGYKRITLEISESTPELGYEVTSYDADTVTVSDDGAITVSGATAGDLIGFTTSTNAASLSYSVTSSDTSVVSWSYDSADGLNYLTVNGDGSATVTISARGINGYADVSVTIPVTVTLTQEAEEPDDQGDDQDDDGQGGDDQGDDQGETAAGDTIGLRSGNAFSISYTLGGEEDIAFTLGKATDEILIGDWDGDGYDSIMIRRGTTYYVTNTLGGEVEYSFAFGEADDEILVGDWDGDGCDTLCTRSGITYTIYNELGDVEAAKSFKFGKSTDEVFAGDWDGDGCDTLCIRRGNYYYLNNTLEGGNAAAEFDFGRSSDEILAGDWDGDGCDTLCIRRGNTYYINNALVGGNAELSFTYGEASDEAFAGCWDSGAESEEPVTGSGSDTLGLRSGNAFSISYELGGETGLTFALGKSSDEILVGDWDGDGYDSIMIRRGTTYYVTNTLGGGIEYSFTFGSADDEILVGDWDGDGCDTLCTRSGITYTIYNELGDVEAAKSFKFGKSTDEVFAGDWDGDGCDTLCIRRGNYYYLNNTLEGGNAAAEFDFGRSSDEILSGDWDGDGCDTLCIRRGNTYYINNALVGGYAELSFTYGEASDEAFAGCWDPSTEDTDSAVTDNTDTGSTDDTGSTGDTDTGSTGDTDTGSTGDEDTGSTGDTGSGDTEETVVTTASDTLITRSGNTFYVSYSLDGTVDLTFTFGKSTDEILIGDWDGNGIDTVCLRRGNTFYVSNTLGEGADYSFTFGNADDEILVGDWDGDGIDTFCVRSGNTYSIYNALEDSEAAMTFTFGKSTDQVAAGDWDGDGIDTLCIRRGTSCYVSNTLGGSADTSFTFGSEDDEILVGDWDGDGCDTFCVRSGNTYTVYNTLGGSEAALTFTCVDASDEAFAGRWTSGA